MAEITITIKIDGNTVTVAQDSQPGVRASQTQPHPANGYSLLAKQRLPRAYDDQKGGEGPGDTTSAFGILPHP